MVTVRVRADTCFEGWDDIDVSLSDSDYKLIGENLLDFSGYEMASAGDVDGDGLTMCSLVLGAKTRW